MREIDGNTLDFILTASSISFIIHVAVNGCLVGGNKVVSLVLGWVL